SLMGPIENAIRNSDLGVNPTNDGQVLRVTVPQLTEERRRGLVKQARAKAEDGRISLRGRRREAMDERKRTQQAGACGVEEVTGATAVATAPSGRPGPTAAAAAPPSRAGRDLTRAIPVGVGLGALVIASIAFSPRWWYLVAAGAVAIGTWEVFRRLRQARFRLPLVPLLVGGQAMVVAAFFLGARGAFTALAATTVVVLVWRLFLDGVETAPQNYLRDVSISLFVLCWIAVPGAAGAMLADGEFGAQRVVALIL